MGGRNLRPIVLGTVTAAALAAGVGTVLAQINPNDGGFRINSQLRFGLTADDEAASLRSGLSVDVLTANRTQRLSFGSDFGLDVPLSGGGEVGVTDPNFTISYLRDTGRSTISTSASYRQRDVDGTIPGPDFEFDESDLIEDDGTRVDIGARVNLSWGDDAPLGGGFGYRYDRRLFTGTSDPDLADREVHGLSANLFADVSPVMRLTLSANGSLSQEDNATETEVQSGAANAGLRWDLSPLWRLNGSLGFSETRTIQTVGGSETTDTRSGATATLGLTRNLANGSLGLDAARRVTSLGTQDTVTLRYAMALREGQDLRSRIGVVRAPSDTVYVNGGLSFTQDTAQGAISLSYDRDVAINNDQNEVLRDTLRARYSHELAIGARIALTGSLINSAFTDETASDQLAAQLGVSLGIPLDRNWSLNGGVTWRETRVDGSDTTNATTVSLSVQRRFSWRP